jgi:hypothetical protein
MPLDPTSRRLDDWAQISLGASKERRRYVDARVTAAVEKGDGMSSETTGAASEIDQVVSADQTGEPQCIELDLTHDVEVASTDGVLSLTLRMSLVQVAVVAGYRLLLGHWCESICHPAREGTHAAPDPA